MPHQGTAMHRILFVIVLSLYVGYTVASSVSSPNKHGSHKLLKLEKSNNSLQRSVRCVPCEKETNVRRPVSNHLDPEYRGNGADNLGYDWSPMAWGGPAYPRRQNAQVGGMRGRDGRMMMMMNDGGRNQGNVQIICDTCRSYWDERRYDGRGGNRGRQFQIYGDRNFGGHQMPDNYETRVMSPTVGVLVKPGSRIAYIPSRSGEMYWDGVSGGGTRWDGFSNGISWVGNSPEWDRSDSEPRNDPGFARPGSDPFSSNSFGPWDNQKRPSNWDENPGRSYYFTNGVPNDIDPQWRGRGYASNWHYGSTNQNGWNGNNMKWNFGGKQWSDNDRAANRFYFNTPQDRAYGPSHGTHRQYGNQYPNYQGGAGYPSTFRPLPSWPTGGSYRPNDRFPANFQQENYDNDDKDRPWDYSSGNSFGNRQPGSRPEWVRPGPGYPVSGNRVDNSGKLSGGYDKHSSSDRNGFEKPWNSPGYGPSKPSGSGGNFPYGGNRYPEEGSGNSGRPTSDYVGDGGHLFFPNNGNLPPSYQNVGSGDIRPIYPSGYRKPGGFPSSENQVPTSSGNDGRPPGEYLGTKRPSVIYTGGGPSGVYPSGGRPTGGYSGSGSSGGYPGGGSSSGGYPGSGSSSGGYPGSGSSSGGYPGSGSSSGGYPGSGSSSGGYPGSGSSSGGYPGSGSSSGGYPGSKRPLGGYPGGGHPSGGYPSTENSAGGYPSSGGSSAMYPGGSRPSGYPGAATGYPSSSYPSEMSRPGTYEMGGSYPTRPAFGYPSGSGSSYPRPNTYPSGGSPYPGGGSRPGISAENYSNTGYFGGRPIGYPGGGRPGENEGEHSRPDGYFSGTRPGYSIRGGSPGGSNGIYQQGGKTPPKGYYTGFITEISADDGQLQYGGRYPNYFGEKYPGDKNFYPGKDRDKYYNGGSYPSYPSGDRNRYPSEDRYYSGDSGGEGYSAGDNHRKYYYGQSGGKGKYPDGYPSNHRYPNGGPAEFDRNQGSSNDKNSWNYGQNERKDGIYRRSGGSYPPYRGGQYYTSSYLASMSTTAGSTPSGSEPKTQNVTKTDEVTQPTPDST